MELREDVGMVVDSPVVPPRDSFTEVNMLVNAFAWPRMAAAVAAAGTALIVGGASSARAQSATAPDVGQVAPDFTASGATRYGVLRDPISLAALRGKTVVLAFFFKARTKG
jgi:cytochrome oxidase Cu insertion factor (SCO1/SenC/PrrC family)